MTIMIESHYPGKEDKAHSLPLNARSVAAKLGLALAASLLLAAASARGAANLAAADRDFLLAAAQGGMLEVKLGELAVRNGSRDEVKAFGRMMVTDHTAINDDLKALAAQKGMAVPAGLDEKHQKMVDKMAALNGPEFDKAYVSDMIEDHKKDADEFKDESANTKDADVKGFVDKSIPIVEAHLSHIKAIRR